MQSAVLTAASLLIVVLEMEHRTASNHMVIACSHAAISSNVADMQAPNGQANAVMKTKTCLFTCIQPGEIACGAAVSLDRTLLCDLEEVCDGLQLHGSRPLASKRDE
jgi:hypothetical protein